VWHTRNMKSVLHHHHLFTWLLGHFVTCYDYLGAAVG
jgi:hypothetical protein